MTDEDGTGEGELIIYRTEDGTDELQLRLVDGSVWLTQAEIGTLFDTTKQNVSLHRISENEAAEREAIEELAQIEAQAKRLPKPASPRTKLGKKAS